MARSNVTSDLHETCIRCSTPSVAQLHAT